MQALLGIAAIKNISEQGIAIKAYDYNENVGGNWIYSKNSSHSSVFETTLIISSKMLSQHEDFPFKASVADYLSHQEWVLHCFRVEEQHLFECLKSYCRCLLGN